MLQNVQLLLLRFYKPTYRGDPDHIKLAAKLLTRKLDDRHQYLVEHDDFVWLDAHLESIETGGDFLARLIDIYAFVIMLTSEEQNALTTLYGKSDAVWPVGRSSTERLNAHNTLRDNWSVFPKSITIKVRPETLHKLRGLTEFIEIDKKLSHAWLSEYSIKDIEPKTDNPREALTALTKARVEFLHVEESLAKILLVRFWPFKQIPKDEWMNINELSEAPISAYSLESVWCLGSVMEREVDIRENVAPIWGRHAEKYTETHTNVSVIITECIAKHITERIKYTLKVDTTSRTFSSTFSSRIDGQTFNKKQDMIDFLEENVNDQQRTNDSPIFAPRFILEKVNIKYTRSMVVKDEQPPGFDAFIEESIKENIDLDYPLRTLNRVILVRGHESGDIMKMEYEENARKGAQFGLYEEVSGWGYNYIVTVSGRLIIACSSLGHHSQLCHGGPVLCAGFLEWNGAYVTYCDNWSGHYKPTKRAFVLALKILKQRKYLEGNPDENDQDENAIITTKIHGGFPCVSWGRSCMFQEPRASPPVGW